MFLNGQQLDNMTTFEVDSTGNTVSDPTTGFPILIKNNQITRPVNAFKSGSAAFGPNAGVTSVLEFIPGVPSLDDPVPVEPPVTFQPPATGKKGRSSSVATTKTDGKGTSTVTGSGSKVSPPEAVTSRQPMTPHGR